MHRSRYDKWYNHTQIDVFCIEAHIYQQQIQEEKEPRLADSMLYCEAVRHCVVLYNIHMLVNVHVYSR